MLGIPMKLIHNTIMSAALSVFLFGCSSSSVNKSCQIPDHDHDDDYIHAPITLHPSIMYKGPNNDVGYTNVYTRYKNLDRLYYNPSFYLVDGSLLQHMNPHDKDSNQVTVDRAYDDWLFFQMGLHYTDCENQSDSCLNSQDAYAYHISNGSHILDHDRAGLISAFGKNEINGKVVESDDFVQFDFESYELNHNATFKINELAEFLKRYPTRKIVVNGSSDAYGGVIYNKNLSRHRAESVVNKLKALGVPIGQIIVSWKGEYKSGFGPKFRIAEINYD